MADRTIAVTLIARADQYLRTFDEAARKSRETASSVEQQLQRQREAFTNVGQVALGVGTLAAAGAAIAITAYAGFDSAMSSVQAATRATAEEQALLRQAALDAGASTVFSATESANAIEELAKAGLSTQQILGGGLDAALDLAAAGQLDVARAAEITAISLAQFNLQGDEATRVADLLAAGAGYAVGSVDDLANALKYVGPQAQAMGIDVGDAVGVLAMFAQNGILGEQAGTSLRGMLASLTSPTARARDEIDRLGISLYDQNGQFLGLENLAGQLSQAYSGMSDEARNASLGIIVGNESLQAANILIGQGAEGVAEWIEQVDAQGYAAEVAATRLDNLKGDVEALSGALETMLINLGEGADGPLRTTVQIATDLVNGFSALPDPMQNAALGALLLVGAIGLVGGGALVAIPQVASFKSALGDLGITAGITRTSAALLGTTLGVLALAVTGVALAQASADAAMSDWAADLANAPRSGTALLEMVGATRVAIGDLGEELQRLPDLDTMTRGGDYAELFEFNRQMGMLGDTLAEMANSGDFEGARAQFQELATEANLSDEEIANLIATSEDWQRALRDQATEMGVVVSEGSELEQQMALAAFVMDDAAVASEAAAEGIQTVAEASEEATQAAQDLYDAHMAVVDMFFASQDAASAYEQSIDDIAAAFTDGLSPAINQATGDFDLGAQSGRDAADMLQGLITNANESSIALANSGASASDVAARQAEMRQQIYDTGIRMGLSADQAQAYADRLVNVPSEVFTAVAIETSTAQAQLESFLANNSRRQIVIGTEIVSVAGATTPGGVRHGYNGGYASGGRLPGYAPGYDDRLGFDVHGNVYGLGGGEYIMPTLATDRYFSQLQQMRAGTFPTYATGGVLGAHASPSYASAPSYGGDTFQVVLPGGGDAQARQSEIGLAMAYLRHMSRGGRRGRR